MLDFTHMSGLWLYFTVVFFMQLLLFLIHAYYEKKLANVPRVLWRGAITGIVFGPLFDLTGKYLGLVSYALGFGPFFLILNAILLYGLFFANILLMRQARLLHFFLWTTIVVAVFETTNLFIRLWTYTFAVPSLEYFIIAFGAPLGLAMIIAITWHVLFGYRFVFIDNVTKKGY